MRVAIAGKGGAGKTTLSATVCRLLSRRGHRVVAIDADSNPNLAIALGLVADRTGTDPFLPTTAVSRRLDGPALAMPVDEVLKRHAVDAPDGVQVTLMGMPRHAEEGCLCSAHAVVSAVLGDIGDGQDTVVVVDMEASPEHVSRGTTRHVDMMLLVTEPYFRSLETIRRLAELASELPIPRLAVVANKVRSVEDRQIIDEFCARHGLDLVAVVPWGDSVIDADRQSVPLIEADPTGDVVAAIESIADLIGSTEAA